MALAIEQERKQVNILGFLVSLVVIAALFAGVYFFLFKRPEVIDVVLPKSLKEVGAISNIAFQPEKILMSEKLKALRKYGDDLPAPQTGKSNPFQP